MSEINAEMSRLEVLIPNTIASAQLITSPAAEPDATKVMPDGSVGEVDWVSHPSNVLPINTRRIRSSTHRVYRDTTGGISTTAPENDPVRWFDEGPTNRWALFDTLMSTKTTVASPATWVLDPGAASDMEIMGLVNVGDVRLQVLDAPAGTLVHDQTQSTEEFLSEDPHWEFYFVGPRLGSSLSFSGLPINPLSRVTVTASSYNGEPLGIGIMAFGVYEYMGLSQYGFETVRRNYAYEDVDQWGNEIYRAGLKAKDLRGTALIEVNEGNAIDQLMEALLDVGAIYRVTRIVELRYLKTWGRLQPATIRSEGPAHASVGIDVRGKI